MESQPQNPEFRNDTENFHPYVYKYLENRYLKAVPYLFFEQLGMLPSPFSFISILGIANVNWVFIISNKYLFGYFGFSVGHFCKC